MSKTPRSLVVGDESLMRKTLTEAGFIQTKVKRNQGKVTFEEWRDHGQLRAMQQSLAKQDPHARPAVVSLYFGQKLKMVLNPEAADSLQAEIGVFCTQPETSADMSV